MKKNVYFVLVLLMLAFSACNQEPQFKVEGTVTGAADKMLYLEASAIAGIQPIDSVKLDKDGKFVMNAPRPESPEFYRLRLDHKVIHFAVDSLETISIQADLNKFDTGYSIDGSQNSQKIKELVALQAKLQSDFDQCAMNNALPLGIKQEQMAKLIKDYKDTVKREYIFKDPKSTYAYFALFQTLNGYMIFDSMTNADDVKCFAAVATSMNNLYPHADRSRNLYNMTIKGMKNTRKPVKQSYDLPADKIKQASLIDIELRDIKGNVRRLTDLNGKVVLLDFTVYNNVRSADHNLSLRELYAKYHKKGFEIYQISLDENEHFWKTASDNLPWICVRDPKGVYSTYASTYNVKNLPGVFLIDRDNVLRVRGENVKDIDKEIQKLL